MHAKLHRNTTIAVVGGGLAGIAATVALSKAGFCVELFEAKDRLGGRAGSFEDPLTGEVVDYCQHVGMQCCTNLKWLIDQLGQSNDWSVEKTLHFFDTTGQHLPLYAWPCPAPLHLSGLLLRWPGISFHERIGIAQAVIALLRMPSDSSALDDLAIKWLEKSQTPNCIQAFWSTIMVSALGESLDRVALRPARKVLLDGFANHPQAYQLLIPKHPLSKLFDTDVRAWLHQQGNVKLNLNTKIDRIIPLSSESFAPCNDRLLMDKRCALEISRLGHKSIQNFDAVIVSVPWFRLPALLDPSLAPGTVSDLGLQASPITGIHTWWDKAWLPKPHAIMVNRLSQWIFPKAVQHAEVADQHYYQIVISASREFQLRQKSEIETALRDDLQTIFPDVRNAKLLSVRVVTDPRSVFSVTPQSSQARWSVHRFAHAGLWLAGDWTDTGWPATMEGAIRSGFQAAKEVAAASQVPLALPKNELAPGQLIKLLTMFAR